MPGIVRSETIDPRALSEAERAALTDALVEVFADIFDGVDGAYMRRTVIDAPTERTTLLVHRNEEGRIVGCFAVMFYERTFRGAPTIVVRSVVGTMRAYRGGNVNIAWALRTLLAYRLEHLGKAMYGLGAMGHPSSYLQVVRYVGTYWPRPDQQIPDDILAFMLDLADAMKLQRPDLARPLVCKVPLSTRETEAERAYWRQSDRPAVRFYLDANPAYADSFGLLTLFPIDATMLATIGARISRERARKLVDGVVAQAQRLPLGRRLLRPRQLRAHLHASPLFASLDDANLRALIARSESLTLGAGSYVFREGDPGRDLYLVARGAVYVVGSGDVIIDQLGTGAIFGEFAALSGTLRTASVRTAIPTTLVRISAEAIRSLMDERSTLRDAVWSIFAARVFDGYARSSGRFSSMERAARLAWVARAAYRDLRVDEPIDPGVAAYVIVLRGALRDQDGTPVPAPAVVELRPDDRYAALTPVRVALVPPASASRPGGEHDAQAD